MDEHKSATDKKMTFWQTLKFTWFQPAPVPYRRELCGSEGNCGAEFLERAITDFSCAFVLYNFTLNRR
jgi:hypothetical protein